MEPKWNFNSPSSPILCSAHPAQLYTAALLFHGGENARKREVCSLSFCISLSRAPLSDKEGEVRVGWGGQGSGSRGCGGQRAGLESFQVLLCKHTCALWVHIIYPGRANSPLYPWVPAPACAHTLPPGWPHPWRAPLNPTLPSSPPSCFPPHPRPQNSPACHVRTVPANTLGRVPGRRNLSQEAGELASLVALLFAWPRPQVGWEAAAVFWGTVV